MPIATTQKAARAARRQISNACAEVRDQWTGRERRRRRIEACQMQSRLIRRLGLRPEPALATH